MITLTLVFPNGTECYVDVPVVPRVGERVRLQSYKGDDASGEPTTYAVAEVTHGFRTYHKADGVHYWDEIAVRLACVSM